MNPIIDIFRPDGTVSQYRRLSARLPEFLATYPPAKGFRILIEATDALSLRPGLIRLYEAAIQSGRTLAEAGLPALAEVNVMCFKASLSDVEGHVLATASALKPIQSYKDWEIGETAARQRLLAACGYGGDVLDQDEVQDMADQGLRTKAATLPTTTAATAASAVTAAETATVTVVPSSPAITAPPPEVCPAASLKPMASRTARRKESATTSDPPTATTPPPAPVTAPTGEPTPSGAGKPVPDSVLRQLEHQARLKGVPAPQVQNLAQAKAELQRLFALKPAAAA
ncbi:MAG: hypothetical protein U1F76_22025 [Candidatus Competibacteraceae bacterium]